MDAAGFDRIIRAWRRGRAREGSIHWGDETGVRDQDQIAPSARTQEVTRLTLRRDLYKSPPPVVICENEGGWYGCGQARYGREPGRVLLRLFVLAPLVMMGRLMVMMRGGVVVSGGGVVMLTRRMLR
jgi:hypothetical protein